MPADKDEHARMPYQLPMPVDALPEIVIPDAFPADDRLWVPQAENVWFRPLCLNRSQGYWMNLLKVRKAGVLSRHRHPQSVHGFVLKGRWRYLEHDWVATEGSYVFEPPGETHTLVVPEDVEEMITYFQVNGIMYYVDPWGKNLGYEDVFTKIDMCRAHFERVGLGADYVDTFHPVTAMGFWPNGVSTDRHVLVSGGTSGIGAAVARAFLAEKARVTVTGAGEAGPGGRRELEGATVRQLDVRDGKAIAELIGGFDRLDHLVNCAGVIRRGDELRPDVFAEVVDINLTGTMRALRRPPTLCLPGRAARSSTPPRC